MMIDTLETKQPLSAADLDRLAAADGPCLVSLLMATHRGGRETRQDAIRLKNLIRDALEQISSLDGQRDGSAVSDQLNSLLAIEDQLRMLLPHHEPGLGIFLDGERIISRRVEMDPGAEATVGRFFHIKPILARPAVQQPFYVVCASKDELHLLDATHERWRPVSLDDLPAGREAIMKFVDEEKHLNLHAGSAAGERLGRAEAIFHGHGTVEADDKMRTLEYFQAVARVLGRINNGRRTPIVFAGVDYLFPIFREAARDLPLEAQHVSGNFDEVRTNFDDVHKRARQIIDESYTQRANEAIEQYGNALGRDQATADIREITLAAHEGRIAMMLFDPAEVRWGSFDLGTANVEIHDSKRPCAEDLVNIAAVLTMRHRGNVFAIERSRMPDEAPVAAVYRY